VNWGLGVGRFSVKFVMLVIVVVLLAALLREFRHK
jgi:membrane protein implicated in regulation of membrane protease activity